MVGIPTVVPFHRAVLQTEEFAPADPAKPFTVHTRWIETEFADRLATLVPAAPRTTADDEDDEPDALERVVVEVGGKRLEVVLPAALAGGRTGPAVARRSRPHAGRSVGRRPPSRVAPR